MAEGIGKAPTKVGAFLVCMVDLWLPRLDSNQNYESQNLACYQLHYEGIEPVTGIEPATSLLQVRRSTY